MSLSVVQRDIARRFGHMIFGSTDPRSPTYGRKTLRKNFGGLQMDLYHGPIKDVPRKFDMRYKEAVEFANVKKDKRAKLDAKKAARKAAAAPGKRK